MRYGYGKPPTKPEEIDKYRDFQGHLATSVKHADAATGAVYYTNNDTMPEEKRPWGMGFSGKRTSPDFNYSFSTIQRRDVYIAEWLHNQSDYADRKQKAASDRKAFKTSLKVGDVLYGSWGYDQTNCEFWRVTEVTNNRITVGKLYNRSVSDQRVVPGSEFNERYAMKIKIAQPGDHVTFDCFQLRLWDGTPRYETDARNGN